MFDSDSGTPNMAKETALYATYIAVAVIMLIVVSVIVIPPSQITFSAVLLKHRTLLSFPLAHHLP